MSTTAPEMTVRDLMDRLARIPEEVEFERAWEALGVAVLAAVRAPSAPPLVAYGDSCPLPEPGA